MRTILALAIGSLGGFLFSFLDIPLAWMMGAMMATAAAALVHLPVAPPARLRPAMKAVIGTMLGAAFSSELVAELWTWGLPVAGLLVSSALGAIAGYLILRRLARLDPVTAYFGSLPAGLTEMTLQGDERGGDAKSMAIVHSVRIFSVVLLLPVLLVLATGTGIGVETQTPNGPRPISRRCCGFWDALLRASCSGACCACHRPT